MRRPILTILLFFLAVNSYAQFFYYGQEPASLKWKSLLTAHFKIIYTQDMSVQAYYYGQLLEKNYQHFYVLDQIAPKRTPVVLHNRDILSNGFSVLAPLRMEVSTVPSQDAMAQGRLQLLAVHEYRHSMQIALFEKGFARHFTWLFGDVATAAAMSRLPFWFIEGEAVWTETAFTSSGRGRNNRFTMLWDALADEKTIPSYDKAVNGSYKDFIPNYYKLGYHLYNYGLKKYGDTIWKKTAKNVADHPYGLRPFSSAIKRITGKPIEKFYQEAFADLQNDKLAPLDQEYDIIPVKNKKYANYIHVVKGADSEFYGYKESLDRIPAFIRISENKEKELFQPGSVLDDQISYAGNKIYWSEYFTHPRWTRKNYGVIKSYDFVTQTFQKETSRKEKIVAPDVNKKHELVAVRYLDNGKTSLFFKNLETKTISQEEIFSEKEIVVTPKWAQNGKTVVYILINDAGKTIMEYAPDTHTHTQLLASSSLDITQPYLTDDYLLFLAPIRGVDELYALDRKKNRLYRLISDAYNIHSPAYNKEGLITFSKYTSDGYQPCSVAIADAEWEPVELPTTDPFESSIANITQPIDYTALSEISSTETDYHKGANLFHFHSLTPIAYSKTEEVMGSGVSVHSQNNLSTLFASAGYYFDPDDDAHTGFADLEYRGWYPIIGLKASYSNKERTSFVMSQPVDISWHNYELEGRVVIPHQFNAGKFFRYAQTGLYSTYEENNIYSPDSLSFTFEKAFTLRYNLYFQNTLKRSHQEIYPRFGQILDINLKHERYSSSEYNNLISAEALLYFPGLMRLQGIKIYGGIQHNSSYSFPSTSYISHPRGISPLNYSRMVSLMINYALPPVYPEFNIGSLLYCKRIRSYLFTDYANYKPDTDIKKYKSSGVELMFDVHLLRLITPAAIGYRTGYAWNQEELFHELLLSINFNIY